ncbi:alpha/beta hydrolase [Pseudomonas mosselii]|uniref:alpha/beta hydrolase n=1 Tax=Pseudomonas mosselii TaxID=78327 RepID=UPI000D99A3B5|nr:alpha/beta hydrolase [Pseudomonas mosselii]PYC16225.1 DUF1749 domain-containing protein [Pseudomonas mosselii]
MGTSIATPDKAHYLISANGLLGAAPLSEPDEVRLILDKAIKLAPEHGLVLHFHGGLVSREYALANIVAPLTPVYQKCGAYPLFFVWESGFREAIWNNKADLLKDPALRELIKKVSEWVLKQFSSDGQTGFPGGVNAFREAYDQWFRDEQQVPPVDQSTVQPDAKDGSVTRGSLPRQENLAKDINQGLANDPHFKSALAQAYNAVIPSEDIATKGAAESKVRATYMVLSEAAVDEMFKPVDGQPQGQFKTRGVLTWLNVARFAAKIVIAVIQRFRNRSDHGLYCTIVEEVLRHAVHGDLLGAAVWNQMKNDTQDSFANRDEACGMAVVRALRTLQDADKQFSRITLVGHSTGAIYICNFLDQASKAGLQVPIRVAFLAPAVTCARFAQAITAHGHDRLKIFRMFAMRDSRECEDQMLKPLYTRSLLYFVSGLLEGNATDDGWESEIDMPLVGMERFLRPGRLIASEPVKIVSSFLSKDPDRVVWSPSLGHVAGFNSDSRKHGDFDNDPSTLESIQAFVQGDGGHHA